MKIPAPQFELGSTVEPTPDAAIKPASRVGRVSPASTAMDVLDQLDIPTTRDRAILDIGQRVTELADRYIELRRREEGEPPWPLRGEAAISKEQGISKDAPEGWEATVEDDESGPDWDGGDESRCDQLLRQREEARLGESRFAEERDCAFALLRWLLPVTVAKRIED